MDWVTQWFNRDMNLSPTIIDGMFWMAMLMFAIVFVGLFVLIVQTIQQIREEKRHGGFARDTDTD